MSQPNPSRGMSAKVLPLRRNNPPKEPISDEALALACASGDPAAIAELFDRHERTVTRFVFRLVPSDTEVQDIVQTTFLEVVRGFSRFDGRSRVSTWLLGIAANVVRHHVRSKMRKRRFERCLSIISGGQSESPVPDRVQARRTLALANAALQQLDVDKRIAFVLCEVEGQSAREAAHSLGVSETVIWKRVSDARKYLRDAVPQEGP